MYEKPTYEELERQIQQLQKTKSERNQGEDIVQNGQYRWLVENANELILVAQDGLIRFVNQKAFDYLGYSPEELRDRPFVQYIYPEDREKVAQRPLKRLKGEDLPGVYPFRVVDRDGKVRWMEINAVLSEWNGKPATLNYINDITERRRAEEELRRYEWIIETATPLENTKYPAFESAYGDVTEFNKNRLLLDGVGKENLEQMAGDVMALLDTSLAVYEANGDYAYGIFKSSWCQNLDTAAFKLCGTSDVQKALSCGKWLCHDNCWNDSARAAMGSGKPVDIECVGGIRLYAVPVFAGKEIVGVVNIGYGNPPKDNETLIKLSEKFNISFDLLRAKADAYKPRPDFIVELGKKRCEHMARMIGEIIETGQANENLRKSEARHAKMVANIGDVIVIIDQSGINRYKSPNVEKIFGWKPEDIVGKSTWDNVHPDDLEPTRRFFEKMMHKPDAAGKMECRYLCKDGSYKWIEFTGINLFHDPEIQGLLGNYQDITERKRAEEALIKTQRDLQDILRATTDGIWKWNFVNNELYFSPQYYTMLGYEPDEFSATYENWVHLIHPDDLATALGVAEEYLRTKPNDYFNEFRLRTKNGQYFWFQSHARVAERNQRGDAVLIIGNHIDITERKQAENKLRVAHEKILTILDSIDSTVYVSDMDTHQILFMNKKMITSFGGDKTGEICFSALRKQSEPCTFCTNDRLVDKNGNPSGVYTWHDQNPVTGRFYINRDRAVEWVDGRLVHMQVATDITDMKKMEAQLIQAQKMESIGTLAGGIAHDFNNILFPLIGHAEMLLEDIPEDGSIRDSLNQIYSSSLRARDLVQQILAFARQEKGEVKLMKIQPIVKEAIKLIRSTIPTSISIRQDLQSYCRPVSADPTQIHQIVINLATNAYHAMEENGGELKVNLKEIELGENDLFNPDMSPGLYACLSIADTGMGMNKDVMNRIFDPFFTTKEKGKGTGMGLSVVHGIVKHMNGGIRVYSEPRKGTEFQVYLPIVENASEKQGSKAYESIQGGCERVLVVDDEQVIITMERLALERLGYQVTSRTSSIGALEAFKADPDKFDLVITDMSMPKMPGDKLVAELIKIRPDIPILLCTGFSETMTDEKIKSLGLRGILMKPMMMKDLARKIREILDHGRE